MYNKRTFIKAEQNINWHNEYELPFYNFINIFATSFNITAFVSYLLTYATTCFGVLSFLNCIVKM